MAKSKNKGEKVTDGEGATPGFMEIGARRGGLSC
jgi:hypothetical protein